MATISDQPCVPSGSKCKTHGGKMGEAGICGVKRSQLSSLKLCSICRKGVSQKIARTLNPLILELQNNLRKPRVDHEVVGAWVRLLKSKSFQDVVCPDCSVALNTGINGGSGQVPFVGGDGQIQRGISILVPCSPDQKAIAQIAERILSRGTITFAAKREDLWLTQCVVAANAPHVCSAWGDWEQMPALNMPNADGTPGRGHFGFCRGCYDLLVPTMQVRLMVSLKEAILGMSSGRYNPVLLDNITSIGTPFALEAERHRKPTSGGRTIAQQKAHKAARAEAQKATYVKGPSGGGGNQHSQKKKQRR